MWSVLRTYMLRQVKHCYKWDLIHNAMTTIEPYKIAYGPSVSKLKLMSKQFSNENRYNTSTGKHYDQYFHFIHQNDLYQNTTLDYSILYDMNCEKEALNVVKKITLSISSIGKTMQELTNEELQQVMTCLITTKVSHKFKILHYLDAECAKRTLKWTVVTSLYMLDGWIILDEKFTFNGKFFTVLRNLWCQQIQHCSKENLIQIIYYLGRSKQSAPVLLLNRIEKTLLELSKNITLNEWGIVCNGFFKMKTKIKSAKLIHDIANVVGKELKDGDKYILISILKAFRHVHYFNENFLRFLENYVRKTHKDYSVLECAHFFAMFANVGWYNREVFDSLEMQVIKKLVAAAEAKTNNFCTLSSFGIRIKDIARILWSISHTAHKPKSDAFFETMSSTVKEFMDQDFIKNLIYTIDCVQSLIVMGYYSDNILHKILSKDTFQKLKLSVKKKPFNQLYFIHSSVEIEAPLYKNECLSEESLETGSLLKSTYMDTRERLGVEQLITVMNRYCTEKEEFTCSFILPHIAISSICIEVIINKANLEDFPDNNMQIPSNSGREKMKICLEVLDPTVCLGNFQHCMTGLMTSKIRQLRKLNYGVVIFTPEAVMKMARMTTDDLRLYIDNVFIKVVTESLVTIK